MRIHSIAMPGSSPDQASCWSTFTDITDLKRAEEAIRSAGVNVKAIFDNAGHPMWSVDRAYTIIASNDAFRELWSRLEPTSMIDQILKGLYARAFSGERSTLEQSFFVALDPDGKHREERRFEFCFNPIQVEGQITAVCVAARDITERHNIETRLVHAKESAEEKTRLKSNFLSSMSHELRTPLTAIVANCNVIQELAGADASVQQYVKIIEENSKQLIDIINDILDLARLESRRNDFAGEFVEPVACVQKVVKMLEPMAKKKSVMLSIGRPIVPLKIFVNPSYLERILTNLVGNAIKFTNNGTIIINVAEENIHDVRRVSISVVDTGVGISESFLPYIFDEFRREHHDGSEGSGLGLTITKKLVESMNGSIEIRSSEGKGTTVSVSFPKINHDMEDQSTNSTHQSMRTMSKMDYRVN